MILKQKILPLLLMSIFAAPALATEPFVIKDIRVEGIQRTEAGTVFSYLPVKEGEKLDDEKAAAAWANTPEGKLAYRFAQSGELQRLAKCQGKGWTVEKGNCFPYALQNKGTSGWRLP